MKGQTDQVNNQILKSILLEEQCVGQAMRRTVDTLREERFDRSKQAITDVEKEMIEDLFGNEEQLSIQEVSLILDFLMKQTTALNDETEKPYDNQILDIIIS